MPYQTSYEAQQMPSWQEEPLKNVSRETERLTGAYGHGKEYVPHAPYLQYPTEQRFAPSNPDLAEAQRISRFTGTHEPFMKEAHHLTRQGATPFTHRYQEYMNPYEHHVIRHISEEGMRHLNRNLLPALENKYAKLGQHGSSQHAKMVRETTSDMIREILDRQNQARATGFYEAAKTHAADQAKALEAAKGIGDLSTLNQASRLADISALQQQGKEQQAAEQALRDWKYEDWLRGKEHPFNLLQYKANILHGIPQEKFFSGYRQTPAASYMNVPGQIGQLAANILGARMMNR